MFTSAGADEAWRSLPLEFSHSVCSGPLPAEHGLLPAFLNICAGQKLSLISE